MLIYQVCYYIRLVLSSHFFFFNDPATTEIYPLSLHDALPISVADNGSGGSVSYLLTVSYPDDSDLQPAETRAGICVDRKSTRLNSSHGYISYAVFCLKKKKHNQRPQFAALPDPAP